jgi:hypothetical protein
LPHCASAENWTVQFGKPEHLVFPKNQIFLDSIGNLMLVVPNHLPMSFIPGNMVHNKIIEESNNFHVFVKIGI